MRHRIFGKKLGRNHNQRKALINGMVRGIFTYGNIETTEAKAKTALRVIENLALSATKADLNSRRKLFRYLQDQTWVNRIAEKMSSEFSGQTSNFIKITRIKRRLGDDALIVKLSFIKPISFLEEKKVKVKKEKPKKTVKAPTKTVKTTKNKVK